LEREVEINEGKTTKFQYDENCYAAVYNVFAGQYGAGEYEVDHVEVKGKPIICDIGANVGAFTIWSLKRWDPECVYCYEPLKSNFNQLRANINNLPTIATNFMLGNKAVEAPSNKLYANTQGPASSSFYDCPFKTDEFEEVESISASELPNCNILKVDTEGCEIDIITKYLKTHPKPYLIQFEYHSERDRLTLDRLLFNTNYILTACGVSGLGFGVFSYVDGDRMQIPIEAKSRLE